MSNTQITFGYDQADRLISFATGSTSATYSYNGDGLRVGKTVNGTSSPEVWDLAEGLPLMIQDGSTKYITGPGGLPIEQVDGSGTTAYYLQDQLGSTRGLIDSSGNVVGEYTFNAWGTVPGHRGASTPLGYAGQYTDAESGLQYLRARYYDPSTAQFVSTDPFQSQTMEPYSYAAADPANRADPTGLDTFGICLGFSAAWGGQWSIQGCAVVGIVNSHSAPEVGGTLTVGGGGRVPSAGAQVQVQHSNAAHINDVGGGFVYGGGSVVVGPGAGVTAGGDVAVGHDNCGRRVVSEGAGVGIGARIPLPAEAHAGVSNTWVLSSGGTSGGANCPGATAASRLSTIVAGPYFNGPDLTANPGSNDPISPVSPALPRLGSGPCTNIEERTP